MANTANNRPDLNRGYGVLPEPEVLSTLWGRAVRSTFQWAKVRANRKRGNR